MPRVMQMSTMMMVTTAIRSTSMQLSHTAAGGGVGRRERSARTPDMRKEQTEAIPSSALACLPWTESLWMSL